MKPLLPVQRKIVLLALCFTFLFVTGCFDAPAPEPSAANTAPSSTPVVIKTQEPSPTASPTPVPEMMIDEDGDITLRSDVAAQFSATTFPFDHKPVVLIYHTHATESYLLTEESLYVETEHGRSEDTKYNVIAVGNELQKALEERGFTVIHDTSDVEGEDINSAYSRSLKIMQQYDDIDLYIDLHRNSSNQRGRSDNTILINNVPYAKMFFVVGTGIGTYDGEYDVLPNWKNNYTFALSLTEAIATKQPDLIKPIRLKVGRFNQHMGLCLLAEIGTNADTLDAALNTVPYLVDAIESVCMN
ncbi:MAG: stage II sporulation protein P [Clostridiaceae bacterium]